MQFHARFETRTRHTGLLVLQDAKHAHNPVATKRMKEPADKKDDVSSSTPQGNMSPGQKKRKRRATKEQRKMEQKSGGPINTVAGHHRRRWKKHRSQFVLVCWDVV